MGARIEVRPTTAYRDFVPDAEKHPFTLHRLMRDGGTIMFMWGDGVVIPLWAGDGPLPQEPARLRADLGLSEQLMSDLIVWAQDMQSAYTYEPIVTPAESAVRNRAQDLLARLRSELDGRFTVILEPGEHDEAGD